MGGVVFCLRWASTIAKDHQIFIKKEMYAKQEMRTRQTAKRMYEVQRRAHL